MERREDGKQKLTMIVGNKDVEEAVEATVTLVVDVHDGNDDDYVEDAVDDDDGGGGGGGDDDDD